MLNCSHLRFIFYWSFLLPLYEGFGWGARQWKVLPGLRGVFGELIRQLFIFYLQVFKYIEVLLCYISQFLEPQSSSKYLLSQQTLLYLLKCCAFYGEVDQWLYLFILCVDQLFVELITGGKGLLGDDI